MNNKEQRAKEFLNCLGNGKSIYQCESENDMIDEYLAKNIKEFEEKMKNKENVMITASGKQQGMSSAIPISKYINQVFDEELAKLTDKNITEICKNGKK